MATNELPCAREISGPRNWIALTILGAATLMAYYPALEGRMLWDDNLHVTQPELRSVDGLRRIWFDVGATHQYYPLLFSWFWLQHRLWGDSMLGYHLVNVLLHLGAAFLVYRVLERLRIPGALLAAGIFALHPVHVESVAWVTEQKNTLSAVFYLGAMLAYLRFDETRGQGSYALALVLFLAALLSKTVTVTLPAALLIIFWWQRGRLSWRRDVLPLLPFFVLALVDGLFTVWFERHIIGASGSDFELALLERPLLAGRALWFYIGKIIWPTELVFIYPRWEIRAAQLWQWLPALAALIVLVACWSVRNKTRAPLAAALFFVVTLFPALGFLNVYFFLHSYVADHFQYLASLGIIVPLSAVAAVLFKRVAPDQPALGALLSAGLLSVLAVLTWHQAATYRDPQTLYETTIAHNPTAWVAHLELGSLLANTGYAEEGIKSLETALRLKPSVPSIHNNYGAVLMTQGQTQRAIDEFREALRLRPDYAEAQSNLGSALTNAGRPQEAIEALEQSLRLQPASGPAHANLGDALAALGRQDEAIREFNEALALRPGLPKAHDSLGVALAVTGHPEEALSHFQESVDLSPQTAKAQYHLGTALLDAGRSDESIPPLQRAVTIEPNYLKAWANLGVALSKQNRPAEAIVATSRALELARASEQTEAARQLEAWLADYRAKHPAATAAPPATAP